MFSPRNGGGACGEVEVRQCERKMLRKTQSVEKRSLRGGGLDCEDADAGEVRMLKE